MQELMSIETGQDFHFSFLSINSSHLRDILQTTSKRFQAMFGQGNILTIIESGRVPGSHWSKP